MLARVLHIVEVHVVHARTQSAARSHDDSIFSNGVFSGRYRHFGPRLEVACSRVLASSGVSRSCVRRHAVAIVHEVMKGGHQAAVVTLFARATL